MKLFRGLALAGSIITALAKPGQGQSLPDTLSHANWRLYWASEFNTPGDSSTVANQWQFAYPWGRNLGNGEGQYYSGQQVSTDSAGVLHLRARLRDTLRPYRAIDGRLFQLNHESGMLFSRFQGDSLMPEFAGRPGFTYGLFEMRCRLPRTTPSFPAFWLYGNPDEVDIMEASPPDAVSNNVNLWNHEYWRVGPLTGLECSQSSFYWHGPGHLNDDFHTFALIWEPNQLVFYFDGVAIRRETRLLPIGIPSALIADLCIPAWSRYTADIFDIDYIRVYKPRKPWPQPPVRPKPPMVGLRQLPRTTAGVLSSVPAELRWGLHERPAHRPRLQLEASINPRHQQNLALPVRGEWFTPLSTYNDGDTPRHWLASPDSGRSALRWTLLDLSGHAVRSEELAPAAGWVLRWDDLAPGAYTLLVQVGTWHVHQPVYHLGRPPETMFTSQWLTPLAPTTEAP